LSEQKKLVSAYEAAQSQARTLEQRAHETERAARRDFEAALGLTPPPDLPRRFAQIARFRDIERWSHEGVLDQSLPRDKSTHFPLMRLADVVADLENGWSPQCESRPAREGEWAVLKLGAVSFGTFDARQNKALPMRLKPRPELEIRAGEVLISRANITRLVGACAHVQETPPHLMLCDKIFRAVFFDDSPIHGDFLAEVLKTPGVRKQIESRVTGTSPTMKNISKPALLDLEFPLPPTDIQASLTAKLHRSREATSKLLAQAAAARQAAWRAFVAAVFG
jgi:type I restriction enzyme S subunit